YAPGAASQPREGAGLACLWFEEVPVTSEHLVGGLPGQRHRRRPADRPEQQVQRGVHVPQPRWDVAGADDRRPHIGVGELAGAEHDVLVVSATLLSDVPDERSVRRAAYVVRHEVLLLAGEVHGEATDPLSLLREL